MLKYNIPDMRCFNSYNILQLKTITPYYIYLLLVQCSNENDCFLPYGSYIRIQNYVIKGTHLNVGLMHCEQLEFMFSVSKLVLY
jgi:hypothetical protein